MEEKIRVEGMGKDGKITIERVMYNNLIHCGDVTFNDIDAESHGVYPSEVLIANIALALSSGIKNTTKFSGDITRAEIVHFYNEVRLGKYNGAEALKEDIEQQIFEAQRQGRIR